MSEKIDNMLIADTVCDPDTRAYLYLDLPVHELVEKMRCLTLEKVGTSRETPFWAAVRGYTTAKDPDGHSWLVKRIPEKERPAYKMQEIAYYTDFLLKTPAAPTVVVQQDGATYRATKQITNAMQVGSYNYLEQPFIKMLANDLLNRWLFFDEDRNPNNYLVKHDRDGEPFIVVIDYNKADLQTEEMKIQGLQDRFGWYREGKTRFLTLLKPENFKGLSIEDFEQRLSLMTSLSSGTLMDLCSRVFSCGMFEAPDSVARKITDNLLRRIDYLDRYFRTWFASHGTHREEEDEKYAGLGQSFVEYYKRKT